MDARDLASVKKPRGREARARACVPFSDENPKGRYRPIEIIIVALSGGLVQVKVQRGARRCSLARPGTPGIRVRARGEHASRI